MAASLNYLVWYSGNMQKGFEYIYTKFNEGHAFWLERKPGEKIETVTDPDFDFFNPHFNERGETFNWTYDEQFVDMSNVWEHFSDVTSGFLENWHSDYRGVADKNLSNDVEWGVRWEFPGEKGQFIWGVNAKPERYDDLVNYLKSFDPINPTTPPKNLPINSNKNIQDK